MKKRQPPKPIHSSSSAVNQSESWRIMQIIAQFTTAAEQLANIPPAVSILGSARLPEDHPYYVQTIAIAKALSDAGISIVSGGGPAIMEAANKGAYQGEKGLSIGLNITLPHEQKGNDYQDISLQFKHFFARKVMFVKYSSAIIVMPGGFGTLDELTEIMTLFQTGKSKKMPLILVGKNYWQGLISWMREQMLTLKTINEADLELLHITDDSEEVVSIIIDAINKDENPKDKTCYS